MLVQVLLHIIKHCQFLVEADQKVLVVLKVDSQTLVVNLEVRAFGTLASYRAFRACDIFT
jgi:hypothetical protein